MGLWKWLTGAIIGQESDDHTVVADRNSSGHAQSSVATLEPPSVATPMPFWWRKHEDAPAQFSPMTRPVLGEHEKAVENILATHLDGHDLSMPPLPRVPEQVLKRLHDDNCSLIRVAKDISEDQVIAASVLRLANSPMYRGIDEFNSIESAVVRVGGGAIRTLMIHESLKAATFPNGTRNEFADSVWQRSIGCATIMAGLSSFAGMMRDDAFLIGLLHDIGNVVVLREVLSQQKRSHKSIDREAFDYLCEETHQEFGELVAEAWKLPDRLKGLIRDHHNPPADDDPHRIVRHMLQLTDMIACTLGYGRDIAYNFMNSPAAIGLNLNENPAVEKFLTTLPGDIEELFE